MYTFSASGFPAGAPVDPVTGSVTVTFDPLVSNANVPVDAIVLTIGTHTYTPAEVGAEYTAGSDQLLVGGVLNGISAVFTHTDDFFLQLTQASTLTPGFGFFPYSTAASGIFLASTGSVTVTDLAPAPNAQEDPDKVLTRAVDPEGNDTGLIAGLPTHLTLQAAVDHALDGEVIGVFGRSTEKRGHQRRQGSDHHPVYGGPAHRGHRRPVVDVTSSEPITIIGLDTVGGTIGWRVGTDGHDLKGVRATGASQVGILVVGHDNSVSYNAVRQSAVGIRVEGSGNDLRGGTVRKQNRGDGVQLGPTATANTFRTATVQTNGGQGS